MATEATVTRNAQAVLESRCLRVDYARKVLRWIFKDGQRLPRSVAVDLFGCFDGVGFDRDGRTWLVQWTSAGGPSGKAGGDVAERRGKLEEFLRPYVDHRFASGMSIEEWELLKATLGERLYVAVWAWVTRRGFRVWRFDFGRWSWSEDRNLLLPPTDRSKTSVLGGESDVPRDDGERATRAPSKGRGVRRRRVPVRVA